MNHINGNKLVGNPAVLRRINRVRILSQLRLYGPSSRADMARRTGLDPKTLTNLCQELLDEGLIAPRRSLARGRGRPAEVLSLNPEAALSLGVDVGARQVSMVVLDLQGEVRHQWQREYGTARSGDFLLTAICEGLAELMTAVPRSLRGVLQGIGLCVPGFLDRERGIIRQSVNIRGFRDVKVFPHLKAFGWPVLLEESSRCMALAEKWFGGHRDVEHLISIDAGYGIGMGVLHHGRLYRGANEVSGEIGHTVVDPKGRKCRCGNVGCLETVASGKALERIARSLALSKMGIKSKGAKAIFEAALAGHPAARSVLAETGHYIGMAIANVINLFDPDVVVLNGGLTRADQFLMPSLRKAVRRYAVKGAGHLCVTELSTVGLLAGARGAAMLPLREHFEFENIQL